MSDKIPHKCKISIDKMASELIVIVEKHALYNYFTIEKQFEQK